MKSDVLKGFRFGMLLQAAIGPICLLVFGAAVTDGFISGFIGTIAAVIVDSLYVLAAILGIGALLDKGKNTKTVFRYVGAVILILFGTISILGVFGINIIPSLNVGNSQNMGIFMKILIITLANPMTIVFWVGVFSTKITDSTMTKRSIYLFGLGAVASTLVALTIVSLAGSITGRFLSGSILNILNIGVGLVLIGFGFKQALTKAS